MRTASIAIVGMGCRFAGAPDLHSYWQMCLEARDGFGPVPEDRWDADVFHDENRRAMDKSYTRIGGFIQDVKSFPALELGIPPRRVEVMDPQQRFALEVALQAIQDSGHTPDQMPRRTGVFMGVTATEWRILSASRAVVTQLMLSGELGQAPEDPEPFLRAIDRVSPPRPFTAAGVLSNMIAATIAQELDLHGPAYTVDSACASAMIAINDAVHQLRAHAIDAAVAGGVYLCLTPDHHIAFSRIGAISPSGVNRPFDHRADGFVQGDGAAAIVLKRLEDVDLRHERVYATIEGIATNNDGGDGDGPMAPVQGGQVEVIEAAWADAGLPKSQVGYVEAHGTGTEVGDVIEVRGLDLTLGQTGAEIALGSSKANVGHTMSAAGVAGLVRATLAIHHGTIPPMANFEAPKESIALHTTAFHIPTAPEPWRSERRVAGVSSFGFGGTNAHCVLASPAPAVTPDHPQAELVLMSGPSEQALRALAGHTALHLRDEPDATVAGVAAAWATRRPLKVRLSLVAASVDELITKLEAICHGEHVAGTHLLSCPPGTPKIAFLYPGQGAQRTGMLADIGQRFPVVASTLDNLEDALSDVLRVPLTHLLYPERRATPVSDDHASAELTATEHCQPALLACGMALTTLLKQVGVKPTAVVGHSLGEFTAAAAGGVLSAAEATRFVAQRGRAMADLPGEHGVMAAIMADHATVSELLVEGAVIANLNHPRQIVISGTEAAVDAVVAAALAQEIKAKRLDVSHGFHSPVLAKLDVDALVDGLALSAPNCVVASGIAATPYADDADAREVFRRHAVSPVDFDRALHQCQDAGVDLYLQVGAGGPLGAFARGCDLGEHRGVLSLAGLEDHDGGRSLLDALGQLWLRGVNLNTGPLRADVPVTSVPAAVLPREPYWIIQQRPQPSLKWKGISLKRRKLVEAPSPEVAAPAATSTDDIDAKVIAVIARVSAYPREALKPSMGLIEDLGFDSLMVGDLATDLAEAFPGLGGIPQELLINRPSVQDMIDYVSGTGDRHEDPDADENAPLKAWVPTWVSRELPDADSFSGSVRLAGPNADAWRGPLSHLTLTEGPADWVFYAADLPPIPPSAVLAGEAAWVDRAGDLIDVLSAQAQAGASPKLIVLHHADDPWVGALAGVARSLPREWPGSFGKCVGYDSPLSPSQLLLEAASWDQSPDVRYLKGQRQVAALAPSPSVEAHALGADDTVLITGGTRGIGAKLASALVSQGAKVLLVGRSAPGPVAQALISAGSAVHLQVDVTDRPALLAAARPHHPISAMVHCAGVLADGPLGQVDPELGASARRVKVEGWLNALVAAGDGLRCALGVGSWSGRFGNRHQAHYAAANAQISALAGAAPGVRGVVSEFGPWSDSEMVRSIPTAIQATMRSEGVDFVADEPGVRALLHDLQAASGAQIRGRRVAHSTSASKRTIQLSTASHPYLADHAIEGTPVLPLAAAADLLAYAAQVSPPFVIEQLELFQGVSVKEPVEVVISARGDRAEIRVGERQALAYRARVRPLDGQPELPTLVSGGEPPSLSLRSFYDDITFHGPALQGLQSLDGLGPDFARGTTKLSQPRDWIPDSPRHAWAIDPLALDSAMQLSGYVAWERFKRAGTPVGIGRYVQLRPWPTGPVSAQVSWGDQADGDRFVGTLLLHDADGPIAIAADTVAELRQISEDAAPIVIDPKLSDPSAWSEVVDLEMRLQMAEIGGIRNPFFAVHDGTARNITHISGREFVNYSSYNYVGLSGDPRVLEQVTEAVKRYGTSVSASRVASGERPFHGELEAELAAAQGVEDAVVFTAGHATNVTTIGHLFGPEDLIFHDELIHDSALQGIKLSGASRRAFHHDDPAHLGAQLSELRHHYRRCLIVIEGVYSMDGDVSDLPAYVALKQQHGCLLMVDEAHSFGVIGATGRGIAEHYGIDGSEIDLWMGTLSKSLASCGGWIAGCKALIRYLRYTAPGFVYSAGITPANAVAALSSLRLMLAEPWRVHQLQANAKLFHDALVARGVSTGPARGASGVVPAVTGNSMHALMLSQRLVDQGINVQPIVFPAVADDSARLRFFLSSTHTSEQLEWTAERVADTLAGVRKDFPVPA